MSVPHRVPSLIQYLTAKTMSEINLAISRQNAKFGNDPIATYSQFAHILGEEFGEVCRAINQQEKEVLRKEVLQCVAVCCAWLQDDLHYGPRA